MGGASVSAVGGIWLISKSKPIASLAFASRISWNLTRSAPSAHGQGRGRWSERSRFQVGSEGSLSGSFSTVEILGPRNFMDPKIFGIRFWGGFWGSHILRVFVRRPVFGHYCNVHFSKSYWQHFWSGEMGFGSRWVGSDFVN